VTEIFAVALTSGVGLSAARVAQNVGQDGGRNGCISRV
jgi:hypothetical protein